MEKDQLLYTIDSSDVSTSAESQAQNSYSQAQNSYSQAVKAKYPTADISGTVSEVYVSNGDTVNAGTEILKIAANDDLSIDFQFSYANDGDFYVGQPAKIYINGYAGYLGRHGGPGRRQLHCQRHRHEDDHRPGQGRQPRPCQR